MLIRMEDVARSTRALLERTHQLTHHLALGGAELLRLENQGLSCVCLSR